MPAQTWDTSEPRLQTVEHLIAADKLSDFLTEYKKLKTEKEACDPVKDILKRIEIIQSMDKLIQASVNTIGKEIYSNLPSCYKRGACPVVKCNLPEFQLADIISVHDLKDYGDCDEEIYLSLIGNRSGLAGAKSSLFYQAFRIIQEMRDRKSVV